MTFFEFFLVIVEWNIGLRVLYGENDVVLIFNNSIGHQPCQTTQTQSLHLDSLQRPPSAPTSQPPQDSRRFSTFLAKAMQRKRSKDSSFSCNLWKRPTRCLGVSETSAWMPSHSRTTTLRQTDVSVAHRYASLWSGTGQARRQASTYAVLTLSSSSLARQSSMQAVALRGGGHYFSPYHPSGFTRACAEGIRKTSLFLCSRGRQQLGYVFNQ